MFSAAQIAIRMFASGLILLAAEAAWGQFLPLAAVADTSNAVPGGAMGEVFSDFGFPSLSGGSVAFSGVGDKGTQGIYTDVGGSLAAVADNSTAVPGGEMGEVFSDFGDLSLSGGSVAFRGVGGMGTRGIYSLPSYRSSPTDSSRATPPLGPGPSPERSDAGAG